MRILHTSDWHLGDRLKRVDRREHINKALEQIALYLETEEIDVMLVSGDIFSDRLRPDQRLEAADDFRRIFSPFLQQGGTIVTISGNHDNEVFFDTLTTAMDMVSPGTKGAGGTNATGRLYIAARPRLLRLADKTGEVVQFLLMPYPRASVYLRGEKLNYNSTAEKHRFIQEGFNQTLNATMGRLDPAQASVLVSHLHVSGAQVHSLFRITENEDVVFQPNQIPTHFAYVAYGHIHKPQIAVAGAEHVRYAGSIERLDFGEKDDQKSVVCFEIKNGRRVAPPRLLPLDATPIYQIEIMDPVNEIPHLTTKYPDHDWALVKYHLHWDPAEHNRDSLFKEIELIFPNWYDHTHTPKSGEAGPVIPGQHQAPELWQKTVREYLSNQMVTLKDVERRAALISLAEELIKEFEEEVAF
jgi:exonuclease SbcD